MSISDAKSRLSALDPLREPWRQMRVGESIDYFVPGIRRWETLPIRETSQDRARVRLGSADSEWIAFDDDLFAENGKRTARSTCHFPNGAEAAVVIAQALMKVPAKKLEGYQIFEELAMSGKLNRALCLDIFHKIEQGAIFPKSSTSSIESRRFTDSKASLMLEAAFAQGDEGDLVGFRQAPTIDVADFQELLSGHSDDQVTLQQYDDENIFLDKSVTGAIKFLRYTSKFRSSLIECWHSMRTEHRHLLEMADILELKASKGSSSVVLRRTYFSEAAFLIDKVLSDCSNREVKRGCLSRLVRQYINGFGIDTTDPADQVVADIQSSDYMRNAERSSYIQAAMGILISIGRTSVTMATQTQATCKSATDLLKRASQEGFSSAAFWLANLHLEGWGDQPTLARRRAALEESKRLFGQCADLCFNTEESTTIAEQVGHLLKDGAFDGALSPHILLSMHAYSTLLRRFVFEAQFPLRVLNLVKEFATSNNLLPPPEPVDRVSADWVRNFCQRILVTNSSADVSGDKGSGGGSGDGKSSNGPSVASITLIKMWLRQQINNTFVPQSQSVGTEPTLSSTASLWSEEKMDEFFKDHLMAALGHSNSLCGQFTLSAESPCQVATKRLADMTMTPEELEAAKASVLELWTVATTDASLVYNTLDPMKRSLKEQCDFFAILVNIMNSESRIHEAAQATGRDLTIPEEARAAVCEVIKLARNLAELSKEAEPDVVNKHCRSAEALIMYSKEKGQNVETSMFELDRQARPLLGDVVKFDYPTRIGYHNIIDAKRISDFLRDRRDHGSSRVLEERVRFLTTESEINNNWRGAGNDKALLTIFKDFQTLLGQAKSPSRNENPNVELNFSALTYADPWASLMHEDIDQILSPHFRDIDTLVEATQLSYEEVKEQVLSELISEKFGVLKIGEGIRSRLDGYSNVSSRTQLKKKMLFLLETAPDVNWQDATSVQLLGERLRLGLDGRCPDGISSFCDGFIQEVSAQRNADILATIPEGVSKLIMSVSSMIYHMKYHFIKRHLSRHRGHHEGRTVGRITMTYMLALPLGLPGEIGSIKYPRFASEGHEHARNLSSEAVCRRFLFGGDLPFAYGETVRFLPLTLKNVASLLRDCIVKELAGRDRESNELAERTAANPDLEAAPKFDFTIDEKLIETFCEKDVMISTFYQEAKSQGYTSENIFFRPLPDEEDDESVIRPIITRIMKDSVLVRILEVCLYVNVPAPFWGTLTNSWSIDDAS